MKAAGKGSAGALVALLLAAVVLWPQLAVAAGALAVAFPRAS